jgi:hypothetical protein
MESVFFALVSIVIVPPLLAAGPLFPTPLHLIRQVHDPISGKTTVLNEYGYGNRLISVRGGLTSIADYEKGELLEIDRGEGTYSITRFDAIAKATQAVGTPAPAAAETKKPLLRGMAARATKSGRAAEFFTSSIDAKPLKQTIEVGVDRSVNVSKDALEVLMGSAYPGVRRDEHEVVLSAAAPNGPVAQSQAEAAYALPIEQVISYDLEGQKLEFRTSVVRVDSDTPPADLVSIPAGARLVVSRIVAVSREIDQINHPTAAPPR